MKISVRVPIKTIPEGNVRDGHWRKRHTRRKGQRVDTRLVVGAAIRRKWKVSEIAKAERITVFLTRRAPGTLDAHDGLPASLKAVVDGIADSLGLDDADYRIAWAYSQVKDSEYGVDIVVEVEGGAQV